MARREPPAVLGPGEIDEALASLDGWEVQGGKLHREFVFANFVEAFGFMARAALVAERSNHHPEWFNVYRTVRVDLTTHESGGITERDTALARAMNELAG
jgi:4a-hydroxytetrahydrobiopterin dehydratase